MLEGAAVGVAVEEADDVEVLELEVVEVLEAVEVLEVVAVLELEEVVVDADVVIGLNVTAVNTVCSFTSEGCPL